jgi:ribosome-associated translation inhibitor RaiA
MQLCIHAHGIELTDSFKRQTYQKLELALDRLEEQIPTITVYLIDTNGPFLGGVDKACRIVVQIRDQDSIVVEDCDENVDAVIDRITDRLGVVACQRLRSPRRTFVGIRSWLHGESSDEPELRADVQKKTG